MVNPFTLPILGGSLLAAVAAGIHLGESSIGLIDPIHFQGPAVHPRDRGAAIDESARPTRPPSYSELYGWEQGRTARAADCGNCEALRARDLYARDYSAQVPYFGGPAEVRVVDSGEAVVVHAGHNEAAAKEPIAAAEHPVIRYAYYPVDAEEEEAEAPPPSDGYDPLPADKYYPE